MLDVSAIICRKALVGMGLCAMQEQFATLLVKLGCCMFLGSVTALCWNAYLMEVFASALLDLEAFYAHIVLVIEKGALPDMYTNDQQ